MDSIVDIQMGNVESMLKEQEIMIELDSEARSWLADKGYDPAYGARPMRRAVERYLEDPLAEALLSNSIKEGDTVRVTCGKGKDELTFKPITPKRKASGASKK